MAYLTIKEKTSNPRIRQEFEFEIPYQDGIDLLKITKQHGHIIKKTRYSVTDWNGEWEVDVFHGDLIGLVLAERELNNKNEKFTKPIWLGMEVTDKKKFSNASLFKNGL